MKFFIPGTKDNQKAQEVFEGIKKFAQETTGWQITNRKIFKIQYYHNNREYIVEVGKLDKITKEIVMVILESNAFLLCTPNRGVLRGSPIYIGTNEVDSIEDFEP